MTPGSLVAGVVAGAAVGGLIGRATAPDSAMQAAMVELLDDGVVVEASVRRWRPASFDASTFGEWQSETGRLEVAGTKGALLRAGGASDEGGPMRDYLWVEGARISIGGVNVGEEGVQLELEEPAVIRPPRNATRLLVRALIMLDRMVVDNARIRIAQD